MKKSKKIGCIGLLFLVGSCSVKKNAFLNRNYNALVTQYNVLYNGGLAFQKGVDEITSKHEDDFFERLPIEPLTFQRSNTKAPVFTSSLKGPGIRVRNYADSQPVSAFEIAEQKAVSAIQKYSMNIGGKERNKQIHEAYFLLGKSRYYTQRFIPAIEAYDYIIANFPESNLLDETKIWRAKAHIRIQNEQLAIETLELLLKKPTLSDAMKEEVYTSLAMAYSAVDSIHKVKQCLWQATKMSVNSDQRARNLFILGQLYGKDAIRDTATLVYHKLLQSKKAPYKYKIHAAIELTNNSVSDSLLATRSKQYEKLVKKRENRPYLDALYHQLAVLEARRDNLSKAILNYNKSLRVKNGNTKQKTYSYEGLANLYFKKQAYLLASAYYDSILLVAKDKQNLRIKRVERKAKNLRLLSKYEKIVRTNDSLLSLASQTEEALRNYFRKYIDRIKKEDDAMEQKRLSARSFGSSFEMIKGTRNTDKWYFYNEQSLGNGSREFGRIWGNRPLEDNWRNSDKTIIENKSGSEIAVNQKVARYDLNTYLETVPSTPREIDSLKFSRNTALFELGLIYKEQFKNLPQSVDCLEKLLASDPDEQFVLPANYHLYQLYTILDSTKSTPYKNTVLTGYPNSAFAKSILKEKVSLSDEKAIDKDIEVYKIAYHLYKEAFFEEARCFIEMTLPTLEKGSSLIAKFELLKAFVIGKYQKKDSYIAALEKVAVGYTQTEQGKKALEIMKRLN